MSEENNNQETPTSPQSPTNPTNQTSPQSPTNPTNQTSPQSPTNPTNTTQTNQTNTTQTNPTNTTQTTQTNTTQTNHIVITQLSQTITEPGLVITNTQGQTETGATQTQTTFDTTDPTRYDPQIHENLIETVYVDDNSSTETNQLLSEIKTYASKITCSDFHGKGSIDDYAELFRAASNIANETKQMKLDIETTGFEDFGRAADELSLLFESYIIRLQNISIIDDVDFLRSVHDSLKKIYNLSETFGRFKQTILTTSTIKIPKSAHETKLVLENVMEELDCAMNYINYFVNPTDNLAEAALSTEEKNIINKAVITIDNWNTLSEQGVSIAMSSNPDIQFIKQSNNIIKNRTNELKTTTNNLRLRLAQFNIRN
jgi:hypothetical protein